MPKIQVRRGLSSELSNIIADYGEPVYFSDTKELKIGDGVNKLSDIKFLGHRGIMVSDYMYDGEDLSVKFAKEIANYDDIYSWLNARITAGNFDGIHIGDYLTFTIASGTCADYAISSQTFKARIIGINTYKNCGVDPIENMIYFKTDEVIDTPIKWNPTDNNNGTSVEPNPWLASAAYAILNGVNNYTTSAYNKVAHGADASKGGILQLLPAGLRKVLKQKRNLLDSRYSADGLIFGSTDWKWKDMGLLWLPNEIEVFGCGIRSNLSQTQYYWFPESGLSIQFPYFANKCSNRVSVNSSGSRCNWWLSAASSYYTTNVCDVGSYGSADSGNATFSRVCVPLCFCI